MDIVLASASPRRRELLGELFESFEIIPSEVDENIEFTVPEEYCVNLAVLKAREVYGRQSGREDFAVIGADTVVVLNGRIIGKPKDRMDALDILTELRGTVHSVYTGVCVKSGKGELAGFEKTAVRIGDIPDKRIVRYIDSGAAFDKAGGYGIQDFADYITVLDDNGDAYNNVVGLPLRLVKKLISLTEVENHGT